MDLIKRIRNIFAVSLSAFALLSSSPAVAQKAMPVAKENADKPKLIVGIIVDQMRYDYLFRYRDKFGKGGFMRLLNEGFFCENAHYNYVPTFTGPGHACVYTGATPAVNGIIANDWYERNENDTMYCVQDKSVQTLGSSTNAGMMSPRNLLTTTITDELRLSNNFQSKVIGISLKDRGAILPAGHSANAAYWYDGANGNWISSTYYMKDLPAWVKEFNALKLSDSYLSKPWTTLLPIEQYTESTADDSPYEEPYPKEVKPVFPHDFPSIRGNDYELVRKSPAGNTLTKELAIAALKGENMGKGNETDFLAISFSATDYVGHQFGTNAIETEDTYLRLDKEIADLLTYLDENYGKNNVLVFLTADHGALQNPQYLQDNKIPARAFKEKDMLRFLNVNLNGIYGTEKLVSCLINNQIYLDRNLIEQDQINLGDVQDYVADILFDFDGVANTMTAPQLEFNEYTQGQQSLVQQGFYKKRSGDVMIILEPDLIEYMKRGTTHGAGYNYDTHVPLIWYGWKIKQGSSSSAVNMVDIAATLAAMLHIEAPNGCTGKPIESIVK